MAIKLIDGAEGSSTDIPISLDVENDNQNKDISLEQFQDYAGKPFQYSSQGSVDGIPAGVIRKYYDRTVTEFAIDNFDPFRKEIRSEWAKKNVDTNGFFEDFTYRPDPNNLQSNTFQFTGLEWGFPITVTVDPIDITDSNSDLFVRRERVTIKVNKAAWESIAGSTQTQNFIDWFSTKIELGKKYTDNIFQMTLPLNKRTTVATNSGVKSSIAEVKANYNYEIPNYEKQIKDVREQLIQNIYALYSAIEYSDSSMNPSLSGYIDHATLNGKVDVVLQNLLKKNEDFDFTVASYSLYLEAWSRAIKILKASEGLLMI
jgi:hypothetical protein